MRNVFIFIRRYFVFLLFLVLQGVALWMLFNYNHFHRAAFSGIANELTGSLNTQVDKVDDYFHLREENKRVHRMNDSLMNLMRSSFNSGDTSQKLAIDSTRYDTLSKNRRYLYRDAKVVFNSVNFEHNYLQLNRGANAGIRDNMAVISSDGAAVGVVVNVSPNFSQVMSLLHTSNSVSASLKRSGDAGTIVWDAASPQFVTLRGIPRNIEVKRGDTILTSMYSFNFPPGFIIGRVAEVKGDVASGFQLIKVKTAVNFSSLQQVFVVENVQREEQLQLNVDTEKKIEQEKRGKR
jgi:rod shape-determining protein MreC